MIIIIDLTNGCEVDCEDKKPSSETLCIKKDGFEKLTKKTKEAILAIINSSKDELNCSYYKLKKKGDKRIYTRKRIECYIKKKYGKKEGDQIILEIERFCNEFLKE
jgi:hypothetical protein